MFWRGGRGFDSIDSRNRGLLEWMAGVHFGSNPLGIKLPFE